MVVPPKGTEGTAVCLSHHQVFMISPLTVLLLLVQAAVKQVLYLLKKGFGIVYNVLERVIVKPA